MPGAEQDRCLQRTKLHNRLRARCLPVVGLGLVGRVRLQVWHWHEDADARRCGAAALRWCRLRAVA